MEGKKSRELSIVLPLYNEEGNIYAVYDSLIQELEQITDDYEIIFVDDGSSDSSCDLIREIAEKDERVLGITLSRNFGHQIAIVAGLEHTVGNYVVMMDADMQHPAAVINELYAKALEGYDIVNTIREDEENMGTMKRITSKWFYKLSNKISKVHIQHSSSDFRLMNRTTVNALLKIKEKDRFTRGLVSWLGYKQTFVSFNSPKRHSGNTKYSYRKMFGFAASGIFSFSSVPLRISFLLGAVTCLFGILYTIFITVQYFLGNTVPGWSSLMIVILFLGGVQLLSIGLIGEYLARVFNEVKDRPLYYVREYFSKDS
jgi:dolichol-phosphate mannosyltransferase